ncbi:hypothetical protein ACFQ7F_13090 [Streptomyces sp. NPDC056486]|uniref:hypothetical protein n=1 Tax=Streptomyces sp. NPDC056486 TaxID=3345835 RepID=UPI0036A5F841
MSDADEPRMPVLTSKGQRQAEDMADRLDIWRLARRTLRAEEWPEEVTPEDTLNLAYFLKGNDD